MAELSLLPSSAAFSPLSFHHHDQPLIRPPKEFQAHIPGHDKRQHVMRSGSMQIKVPHLEDPWKFTSLLPEYNHLHTTSPVINKAALVDVQDIRPESVVFSFGVAENCTRHEKILKFLSSGPSTTDGEDLDISIISDLQFHTLASGTCPQPDVLMEDKLCLYDVGSYDPQRLIHPPLQPHAAKPLLDFVGNLLHTSAITVHPNGNVLFTGNGFEMKDLLSIVARFNQAKNLSEGSMKAMVIPYFDRKRGRYSQANTRGSSSKFETQTLAPSKSSENNSKTKPSQWKKQQNRKVGDMERDIFSKNYFRACDSLLTVFLDRTMDRTAMLSLKNSSPALIHLLHQFSAGIAGTGLAVLLNVACKAAAGSRVPPLSSARIFSVSFGFGLFWLSWAVNRLRDTIVHFGSKSSRVKKQSAEEAMVMARKVQDSVHQILFRAGTLMVVALLRFV